jgi:hypothetical protein
VPDVSQLLQQYIDAGSSYLDPKQNSVAAAAEAKRESLNARGYRESAGDDVGLAAPQDLLASDYSTAIGINAGRSAYTVDSTAQRSGWQEAGDFAVDGLSSVFTTPVGIANIPISAISPDAGAVVSRFIEEGQANARKKQSDALNDRRRAYGARNEVTGENNNILAGNELTKGDSNLLVSMRRIGRDVLDGFSNMDGAIAGSTIGSAAGSLVTAGPLGRLVSGATKGKLGIGTAIGLQEAGGVHTEITNQVLNMSHEELIYQ